MSNVEEGKKDESWGESYQIAQEGVEASIQQAKLEYYIRFLTFFSFFLTDFF